MAKKILSPLQNKFIGLFAKNKILTRRFYLTGGTALAAYYLQHRYSEDLDFFSLGPIDILALNIFLKESKSELQIEKTDFQQSFNRNLFFLHTKKDIVLKVSDETNLKQIDVKKVVQRTFDCIIDALIRGERIELRNFGVFKIKQRKSRTGRNPRTNQVIPVPPRKVVVFKAGLEMKQKIK